MNLIELLTSPAHKQHDTMMKVIDRANKLQAATVKKADTMKKMVKRTKGSK